jgi:hypothetical protein
MVMYEQEGRKVRLRICWQGCKIANGKSRDAGIPSTFRVDGDLPLENDMIVTGVNYLKKSGVYIVKPSSAMQ